MSYADRIKEQEEQARKEGIAQQGGGDWYKFVEGDNIFKVLAEPMMIFEKFKVGICYTDCGYEGNAKFLTFVLDRKDNKIKLAKLPYGIGTMIAEYEKDEDYSFEGFPMPYNIKVKAVGAGTKEVKYTVTPSPRREELSADVAEQMRKKASIADIVAKMKEKKKQEHIEDGSWQREQDRKAKLAEELASVKGGTPTAEAGVDYPEAEVNVDDIPF